MKVQVKGLDELARELRRVDQRLTKTMPPAHKKVSEKVVAQARSAIIGLPSPGGHAAVGGLDAQASQDRATIALLGPNPTIRASVFGTLSHGGGAGRVYPGSGPWQFWLGQDPEPESLYGLGPVLGHLADSFILDEYADAFMDALAAAFPERG